MTKHLDLYDVVSGNPEAEKELQDWLIGDYDNPENGCENCGRYRVLLCGNDKHRCEKCNWCPELKKYVDEVDA